MGTAQGLVGDYIIPQLIGFAHFGFGMSFTRLTRKGQLYRRVRNLPRLRDRLTRPREKGRIAPTSSRPCSPHVRHHAQVHGWCSFTPPINTYFVMRSLPKVGSLPGLDVTIVQL